jgi:hypothetical protein
MPTHLTDAEKVDCLQIMFGEECPPPRRPIDVPQGAASALTADQVLQGGLARLRDAHHGRKAKEHLREAFMCDVQLDSYS